ncbi:hypothetical protein SAMN04487977_101534 [Treponema bryantii]|uniref:Uncharacterized protein n=1 Tax=Treponema bryantii TaxID=163 RepID=A0A1H9B143_9SPIR|nr:hypothetical protein [Treponema bryantii]SEP82431.1 hypothetical protein SAMN04487977_101534 [Treponema bryantii]
MEESLRKKIEDGTYDEIDKDMIISRIMKSIKVKDEIAIEFANKIKNLVDEYHDELKLARFGIVMAVTDITEEDDECGVKIVYGSSDSILKLMRILSEEVVK